MSSSQNAAHAAPTLVNECAAPVRGVAHATPALEVDVPMHNNVGQGLIPTTLNPVEIAIPSSMLTISDDTAKMFDNLKNIEKQTETVAILTKRMMETPLREPPMVEPPVVESDPASAKRRRRTRYTPLPGIMESVPGSKRVAANATRLILWTVYEMAIWAGAWHPPTLSWVPPVTSPAWQATGRTSCAYVCTALPFTYLSFSLLVAEKYRLSFVYVLAMYMAIQTALFVYTLGRSTDSVMDSDHSMSYTVFIAGLTVILQSTR